MLQSCSCRVVAIFSWSQSQYYFCFQLKILKWLADQTKEKNDIEDILQEEFGTDPQGDSVSLNLIINYVI